MTWNRTARTLAVVVCLIPVVAMAGKKAPKKIVQRVLDQAVQTDVIYQSPSGAPSPAAGSFVQAYAPGEGEEPNPTRIGTYDTATSSCATKLTFKSVPSTEKRSMLVSMKTGLAAALGLPIQQAAFKSTLGVKNLAVAGIKYRLSEKLIVDGGQDEVMKCCVQNPSQCTDEFVAEWWKGDGKIYRVNTTSVGLKSAASYLSTQGGDLDFNMERGFNMSSEWEGDYFAYRTQRLKIPTCEEYLNNNPPKESEVTFTGVSKPLDSEQESRRDARDDAQRQLVETLGTQYQLTDGEASKAASGILSGLLESFVCVDKQDGPRVKYLARARLAVDKTRFEGALTDLKSTTGE